MHAASTSPLRLRSSLTPHITTCADGAFNVLRERERDVQVVTSAAPHLKFDFSYFIAPVPIVGAGVVLLETLGECDSPLQIFYQQLLT